MADRRYKLIGQGLPGSADFRIADLADGDSISWNATLGKWETTTAAGGAGIGAGTVDQTLARWDTTGTVWEEFPGLSIFADTGPNANVLYSLDDGYEVQIRGNNLFSFEETLAAFVPAGAVRLSFAGTKTFETDGSGIAVFDTSGGDPAILFKDGSTQLGFLQLFDDDMRLRNEVHGGLVLIQAEDAGGTVTSLLACDPDGSVDSYYAGVLETSTQDSDADYATSGLLINDHTQTLREVGFNSMPLMVISANTTLDETHVSGLVHKFSGGAVTVTLPSGTSGSIPPVESVIQITNFDTETLTIDAAGSLFWLDGAGSVPGAQPSGQISLAPGGTCWVYHFSDTIWLVWGTAAGLS